MDDKSYNPDEPARERAYVKLSERINTQDDQITYLLGVVRGLRSYGEALERRIAVIESRHSAMGWEET